MPLSHIETAKFTQPAILWPAQGTDDYGLVIVGDPAQLMVRWEWGTTEDGSLIVNNRQITATVFVDQPVPLNSIMCKGELNELPSPLLDLHQVVAYKETPDTKGRRVRRRVLLAKYHDQLPDGDVGTGTGT